MGKHQRANRVHSIRGVNSEKIDLGHLPNLIGYALRRAQLAVFRDFLNSFSKLNIRPIQYGVLTVIERNPGLKQSQVCSALGIKRANFVALLNNLERRGLAKREPTANDQRANALYLTNKGKVLMRKLRTINKVHEDRMTANLSNEKRRHLIQLLNGVILAANNSD
jgi:DNA-binding MarR family transcriptional regulator